MCTIRLATCGAQATPPTFMALRAKDARHARQAPHADVAGRFRQFLDAAGLSRQDLEAAVGGAITARSLFSVLSGQRKPSRALALLIESTWGFRADYLLDGVGQAWAKARPVVKDDLSPLERDVVAFMRESADNARAVEQAVGMARVWSRIFARTMAMLRELDEFAKGGANDEDAVAAVYPLFVKLAYEDCLYSAGKYAQLAELAHRRRVHRLSDRFLARYVDEVPRSMLSKREAQRVRELLEPVLVRRRERLGVLEGSMAALRATLGTLAGLGSPRAMLLERSAYARIRARKEAATGLEEISRGDAGKVAKGPLEAIRAALTKLRAAEHEEPTLGDRLARLIRDVSRELETEVPVVPTESADELRALHEKIVEPLLV